MNTKIKDLVHPVQPRVIFLQTSDSTATAIATLDKYDITSAPVRGEDSKIFGFLDILDLVIYLTKIASKPKHSNVTPESTKLSTDDMGMIAQRSAEFNLSHVSDAIDLSKRNPYYPLHEDQTIQEAVEIFLRGPHRIAVTNSTNHIVHILTQSNIIKWLAEDPTRIALKAEKLASEIMKPVVSISPNLPAIDAFNILASKDLSSVAIVEDDVLVGTLSASDLKSLREFRFFKLLDSASEFIAHVRKEQNKKADYVVHCGPNTPLKDIVRRLSHEHVHRIFVVDEANRPLGVISLSDIIRECFD